MGVMGKEGTRLLDKSGWDHQTVRIPGGLRGIARAQVRDITVFLRGFSQSCMGSWQQSAHSTEGKTEITEPMTIVCVQHEEEQMAQPHISDGPPH